MIDLLLKHAADADLLREIQAHVAAVRSSAGRSDPQQVVAAETAVQANALGEFAFDEAGDATLTAAGHTWHAGRFETPSIAVLQGRAAALRAAAGTSGAKARLWVIDARSPATDIGSLQATAPEGTLFQVASQFNCLESPGPYVTRVCDYFDDPTQGPRASISAFPATLLRHYAAPGPGGKRFIQTSNGQQINLLAAVCQPGVAEVCSGYLLASGVAKPKAFVAALEANFDWICVGVHDGAQVVMGYDWTGAVEGSEQRRIAQVFTSTVAGGGYGGRGLGEVFEPACRLLLRAAYLGTLLAAVSLGRTKVVLTLIGGGVFGNPLEIIWQAIQWALDEVQTVLPHDLDVVVNGRNLGNRIERKEILAAVRKRGGGLLVFDGPEQAMMYR
jgi:hypothetical protein